jgi:hypothetical protein
LDFRDDELAKVRQSAAMRLRTWLLAPAALVCASSPAQSAAVCAKDYPALKDREMAIIDQGEILEASVDNEKDLKPELRAIVDRPMRCSTAARASRTKRTLRSSTARGRCSATRHHGTAPTIANATRAMRRSACSARCSSLRAT